MAGNVVCSHCGPPRYEGDVGGREEQEKTPLCRGGCLQTMKVSRKLTRVSSESSELTLIGSKLMRVTAN